MSIHSESWPHCTLPLPAESIDFVDARITAWITSELVPCDGFLAVDRPLSGELPAPIRRWYIRMRGESKSFITIWLTLNQRTLSFESYMLPAPEENHAEFFEYLLARNSDICGAAFAVGAESAIYLVGSIPLQTVWGHYLHPELDRIIGSIWTYTEQSFTAALHIGWRSRFI